MTTTQTHQIYPPFFKPLKFLKKIKAQVLDLDLPQEYLKLFVEPIEIAFKDLITLYNHDDNDKYLFQYDNSFFYEDWKEKPYWITPTEECFKFNQELFSDYLFDNADNFDDIEKYVEDLDPFTGFKFFRRLITALEEESQEYTTYELEDIEDFFSVYDFTCKLIGHKIKNSFEEEMFCDITSSKNGKVKPILKEFFNETCLRYCWSPHTKIGKNRVDKLYNALVSGDYL